ncbi:hypothetical protein N8I77_007114 [Diaporthe amygdali]|uniref:Uncharacterized protein n=1 Tax=Phomopsis amygdali TaxID=1214568 RepID=A0AAD9W125_PHOAM|nr:hypothetical protein N8I77_007114 [Diaporthe amygdali]
MKYSTVFAVLVAAASARPSLLPRQEKNASVEDVVASFNGLSEAQQADFLNQVTQANAQVGAEQNADAQNADEQAANEQNADEQAAAAKDAAAQDAAAQDAAAQDAAAQDAAAQKAAAKQAKADQAAAEQAAKDQQAQQDAQQNNNDNNNPNNNNNQGDQNAAVDAIAASGGKADVKVDGSKSDDNNANVNAVALDDDSLDLDLNLNVVATDGAKVNVTVDAGSIAKWIMAGGADCQEGWKAMRMVASRGYCYQPTASNITA